jgi:hypothetical protein
MGRLRGDGGAPVVGRSGVMGLVSRLVPRRGAVLEHMDKMAVHFTLDAALKAFTQRVIVFYLVAVLGKHDYLRHQTPALSVVFSVVALILSLEEELTWKFLRRKMVSG